MADSITYLLLGISIALNAVCIWLMTRPANNGPFFHAIRYPSEFVEEYQELLSHPIAWGPDIIATKLTDNETQ